MVRSARSRMLSMAVAIALIAGSILIFWQDSFSAASIGSTERVTPMSGASVLTADAQPTALPSARLARSSGSNAAAPADSPSPRLATGSDASEAVMAASATGVRLVVGGSGTATPVATQRPRIIPVTGSGAAAPEAAEEATVEVTATTEVTATVEVTAALVPVATPTPEPEEEATPVAQAEVTVGETVTATAPVTTAEEVTVTTPVTAAEELTPTGAVTTTAETLPAETAPADLVEKAIAAGNFTRLVAAVDAAGLTDVLRSEGPYTLFAPTDAAFDALPAGILDAWMADPGGELTQVLLYHIVPGRIMAADFADGEVEDTLEGEPLTVALGNQGLQINGATVITANILASNGVIHVLPSVLALPAAGAGEEVTPTETLTATGQSTLTVPIIVNGEITTTESVTGTVPITTGEPVSDTASTSPVQTAAEQAAVVISPPARIPRSPVAAPADIWTAPEGALELLSPTTGGYRSPLDVVGLSQTLMGSVDVTLVDEAGTVLAERLTMGGTVDTHAFFHTFLRFSVTEPIAAVLSVVDMDMAEGLVTEQVQIPLTLLPGQRLIDVTYPTVGGVVCGTLTATGYSNTHEANVVVELLSRDGAVLEQVSAMGGTLGIYRDFVAPLAYVVSDGAQPVLLAAYESDASGRFPHVDKQVVPFTLYPEGSDACAGTGQ